MIIIKEVIDKREEKEFIKLPWKIYNDDKNWVSPLISDFKKTIRGENSTLKHDGPYKLILAFKDNETVGRMLIGINQKINKIKKYKRGYISFFECIDDFETAKSMFDYAINWFKQNGVDEIVGPVNVPNGDDNRGILIDNFDDPPYVINVYNKPYYKDLFEKYGFEKYWDVYAFHYDINTVNIERYERAYNFAVDKFDFVVEKLNRKRLSKDIEDIKQIIARAMPEEWEDFIPLDKDEIEIMANNLVPVVDEDFIFIARTKDGQPIGFNIALPDYNQALKYVNGRLFPFGIFKLLYHKRFINRLRVFVLFVIPEYRKKGVSSAIYLNIFKSAREKGFIEAEGSTIWEYNTPMINDAIKLGGKIYKTYRIFKLKLT
ncbi:hypothetical protein ABG79_00886 [Caloramator mitchellensis]|uniref:N-acetyltransferase domain-containing protein n=1 Tax=Caloramator mitchellensis TaxID=908809 RepID=A0A0R3JU66_CALMK|nr:GNAT family N-acetyltransferase [Caloramator mitchellensis]KRQ87088.1 hypothetical protein ABG79_00886 [Caloramator mitchellensis]